MIHEYYILCFEIEVVRDVRAIKRLFGSDSSKSTKFGPEVDNANIVYIFAGPQDRAAILTKSNMAASRLNVNYRYKM